MYSLMVGCGETYVAAFALSLGKSEVVAGLITTLPILVGALLQIVTPHGVRWLRSNQRWVLLCASVQSASLIPLAIAAVVGAIPVWALFASVSLYWACNLGAAPPWNTWMTMIIPARIRARYFGRRSRLCQLATLAGILLGGGVLALADRGTFTWLALPTAFVALFALASLSRGISTFFLAAQSEPAVDVRQHRRVPTRELVARARHGPDMRLLGYMLAVQVAVQISAAYFTPYMLGELQFSKAQYMGLISVSFLAKSIALPFLGAFAHRFGARRLLWIGGIGIVPLAGLWMSTTDVRVLIGVQIVSGSMWACYELATFLLMLETIREDERTSVLTTFNVGNAFAIAGGSLVGGAMLGAWEASSAGYMLIFGVSTALRLASLLLLRRVTTDVRRPTVLATAPMAVRTNVGSMDRPMVAAIEEAADEDDAGASASQEAVR